jgi:hypothetical protein
MDAANIDRLRALAKQVGPERFAELLRLLATKVRPPQPPTTTPAAAALKPPKVA